MADVQSSASKHSSKRKDSHQVNPDKGKNDEDGSDKKSNQSWSSSSRSSSSSARSRLPMPKTQMRGIRDVKVNGNERRKRGRVQGGKVEKRKRIIRKRRQRVPKRKPREKQEKKERDPSISSIFTRLSECSAVSCCLRCGHRCCRRRYEHKIHEAEHRRYERNNKRKVPKNTFKRTARRASAANQVGSRANMLSSLFIKTNSTPVEQHMDNEFAEVSPEMIHESLRNLSMWKQEIQTDAILEYIKAHYPVNPDTEVLSKDLAEKLRIAALVGIISRLPNGCWWLSSALQKRALNKTHVTLFWQAYADTMKPITKDETITLTENLTNARRFV